MEYELHWRNKWLTAHAASLDEMINALLAAAEELREMQSKGVILDEDSDMRSDYARLWTDDPAVAEAFGFNEVEYEEDEELGDEEEVISSVCHNCRLTTSQKGFPGCAHVPWDDGGTSMLKLKNCPACDCALGELHQAGCDIEPCPYCGAQLRFCLCETVVASDGDVPEDDRLAWKGYFDGTDECLEYGWFARRVNGPPGWVRSSADEPGATPDYNRLFEEAIWNREKQRFVRKNDDPVIHVPE